MGDYCLFDPLEECFHNCRGCPITTWNNDFENEPEYDPYDKYDRED